jgi:type I restriction enzyme S subunit
MVSSALLRDLCILIADCPHSTPKWTDTGVIVLRSNNIRNGRLSLQNASYTDEQTFKSRVRRAIPTEGDIVITREAPMGELCMVPPSLKCCLGQRMVLLRPDRAKVVPRFLLYALQSGPVQNVIQGHEGTGSTVSNLRIPALETLSIPLLSKTQQADAAKLLGALDDRIDSLRSCNEILEAIAQAIFKSWFVDFDPVRAKAEGREPEGMDVDTAALFPSEFYSSEQGPIPLGWHFRRAGDLMKQSRESINPLRHPDELFTHYSLPAFDEGRRPKLEYGREIKSNKTVISAECILLSKLNPHIPRVWLPGRKIQDNAVCSTEFMVFQPATGFSVEYLYCQFVEPGFAQRFGGLTTGTSNSHQRVKPDYLLEEQLIEPTRAVVEAFTSATHSLFEKINANIEAQQTLAELRDTVLPRLISGKLRVPEVEAMLIGGRREV